MTDIFVVHTHTHTHFSKQEDKRGTTTQGKIISSVLVQQQHNSSTRTGEFIQNSVCCYSTCYTSIKGSFFRNGAGSRLSWCV